jgi:hypothetical protein
VGILMNQTPLVAGAGVEILLVAGCRDCKKYHHYHAGPADWLARMSDWNQKHPGHRVEFFTPRRKIPRRLPRDLERVWEEANRFPWWLGGEGFSPNANILLAYAASAAYTFVLTSLASSSTLVAGRESTAVSNTSNLYLDYLVAGRVRAGTTVTAGTIELWAYANTDDTPTYPDVFDGTDSAETVTSADIKRACLKLLASVPNDATNARDYWVAPVSIAAAHGGLVPKFHGLFLTHSMVAALDGTAGNHVWSMTGAYMTSA